MYNEVINFWFKEIEQKYWFQKSDEFDQLINKRFAKTLKQASVCELANWRKEPLGRLAEIIVLDQFSRNLYRNSPLAFASDPLALALSQEVISQKLQESFTPQQKAFLYMPYMHSESLKIQEDGLKLFSEKGLEGNYNFALKHHNLIKRFGRFPHRNLDLGRESTAEEVKFLKESGRGF